MNAIEKWHDIMKGDSSEAPNKLDDLLHDDVVFYSPVVYTPQRGKEITKLYLSAASGVFSTEKKGKEEKKESKFKYIKDCLLYTSPSPRDGLLSRMPSSA